MDVHKDTIVVCVFPPDGKTGTALRKTYRTFRNDLTRMRGWLKLLKVTEIAMESTGVYWGPVWNVFEGHGFGLVLVNPAQVKALQGRRSDRRDAKRIAEFLR
jgi:transposase